MGKWPKDLLDLVKKLDKQNPELRELYRKQKLNDEALDERVEQFTEEVKDLFDHLVTPNEEK